ncbi:glutathione S-transferase [Tirmania nivea]|nr:glutathione S-transferase [Tirmania nivea]
MAAHGKQFTLFASIGPNPWKVTILLHELGMEDSYEIVYLDQGKGETKSDRHTKYNLNGRVPTLIDHSNGDFVVWESGAILEYLVEKYDTERKVSFAKLEEKIQAQQYLFFQTSGQGPYFGQAIWFWKFHAERIPSAVERYTKEIERVVSVVDKILEGKNYLVANKFSYADISFLVWWPVIDWMSSEILELQGWRERYPNVARWDKAIRERPAVAAALKEKEAYTAM